MKYAFVLGASYPFHNVFHRLLDEHPFFSPSLKRLNVIVLPKISEALLLVSS